ncbi:hypothetical protein DICPUDRAFT_74975 [Dictyostelium purpureum]|uniref:MRH domain-containing protein n=1 Tax=Dictyostelium purpureum TaxID=5786 RepID=F0Z9A1_DICPU|nr:uncharacterized protein DICPUDRAFT_74975 [Dictyostelium purpureum]EGC39466.1 hypothetical protein DICPUDRAFT_74975 [Dictyostelium purpureum]|eukprot:XP_003284024.1 hypothetical protein DICPUDRAFT_74975 [Dictyostelium purpureum]
MFFKIIIIILNFVFLVVKSECVYNGLDFSKLYNPNGYTGYSALNWANDLDGRYKFLWNVCGVSNKCDQKGESTACQFIDSKVQVVGEKYNVEWNSDPKYNKTSITYHTEQTNCPNNLKRKFTINLICTDDDLYSTKVFEEEPCHYSVTMYGACGIPIKDSSEVPPIKPIEPCIYNGIDYSKASSLTGYDSSNNEYSYHWNVCGYSSICGPNIAACQKEQKYEKRTQIIGQVSKAQWSIDSSVNATVVTYSTDNRVFCQGDKPRQFKIYLICKDFKDNNSNGEEIEIVDGTIVPVNEDEECIYSTTIYTCGEAIK